MGKNKRGPWTVTKSKIMYKNPWITVYEDDVIRPDGSIGIHAIVEMNKGASVIPIDNESNVYLSQEFRYAVNKVTIEAFSGGINKDESPLEGAKRELLEEAGLTAETWEDVGYIDPFTTVVTSPNYLFIAKDLHFTQSDQEGTETIRVLKVSLEEALKLISKGEITHSATVVILLNMKELL